MSLDGSHTFLIGFEEYLSNFIVCNKIQSPGCGHIYDREKINYCPECGKRSYNIKKKYTWVEKYQHLTPLERLYDFEDILGDYFGYDIITFCGFYDQLDYLKEGEEISFYVGIQIGGVCNASDGNFEYSQDKLNQHFTDSKLAALAKKHEADFNFWVINTSSI